MRLEKLFLDRLSSWEEMISWFRSNIETQIDRYFRADSVTNTETRFHGKNPVTNLSFIKVCYQILNISTFYFQAYKITQISRETWQYLNYFGFVKKESTVSGKVKFWLWYFGFGSWYLVSVIHYLMSVKKYDLGLFWSKQKLDEKPVLKII